jgi:Zn ribbon nucleic-acid-binding protein
MCPHCQSRNTIKKGSPHGVQRYECHDCTMLFQNERRHSDEPIKELWRQYVFGKQTIREMDKDKRTIRKLFDTYTAPTKVHQPRPVHLVADATYFGERLEESSWCVAVLRDPRAKENLVWEFSQTETTSLYISLKEQLLTRGYLIRSVTADGFMGIQSAFSGIPYQMCHVHMERLVTRGTTRKPQTEAGIVLLALVRTLHTTDSRTFTTRLEAYIAKYRNFLNEKTTNPFTGEKYWTHKELRGAVMSLIRYRPYLFTFEQNKKIPRTTNSIEGHFSHTNEIIAVHRGLSRPQKQKVLNTILLASTIAPTKGKLSHIL